MRHIAKPRGATWYVSLEHGLFQGGARLFRKAWLASTVIESLASLTLLCQQTQLWRAGRASDGMHADISCCKEGPSLTQEEQASAL